MPAPTFSENLADEPRRLLLVTWPLAPSAARGTKPDELVAEAFVQAMAEMDMGRRAGVCALVVMPDHAKVLIDCPKAGFRSLMAWARSEVRRKAEVAGRSGPVLGRRYFVREIEAEDKERVAQLIEEEPVRAGLVERAEHWKYSTANTPVAALFLGKTALRKRQNRLVTPRGTRLRRMPRYSRFGLLATVVELGRRLMELLLPWRPRWERKAEEREARLPARGEKAARARKAEEAVVRWMWKRGFRILARNVRNRFGELDIVAERRGKLIAVEVRSYVTGNPRPSGVISRRKVGRVWRALRRFQKLRHSSLGHLQLAVYVAEAEYSLDGQLVGIRLVSAAPADT